MRFETIKYLSDTPFLFLPALFIIIIASEIGLISDMEAFKIGIISYAVFAIYRVLKPIIPMILLFIYINIYKEEKEK